MSAAKSGKIVPDVASRHPGYVTVEIVGKESEFKAMKRNRYVPLVDFPRLDDRPKNDHEVGRQEWHRALTRNALSRYTAVSSRPDMPVDGFRLRPFRRTMSIAQAGRMMDQGEARRAPFDGAVRAPSPSEHLTSREAFRQLDNDPAALPFSVGDEGDTPGPFKFMTDMPVGRNADGSFTATSTVYGLDENTGAYATIHASPDAPAIFQIDEIGRLQVFHGVPE